MIKSVELEMRGKQFYVALYLMLNTVEILSGFLEGKKPNSDTFNAFINRYFNEILGTNAPSPIYRRGLADRKLNLKKRITFMEMLWICLHYGLTDACMVYPRVSLTERSRYYCKYYRVVGLRLDIRKFYRDFLRAYRAYRDDVYSDYLVRQKFIRRFDRAFSGKTINRKDAKNAEK